MHIGKYFRYMRLIVGVQIKDWMILMRFRFSRTLFEIFHVSEVYTILLLPSSGICSSAYRHNLWVELIIQNHG
jgi:hypothetical protein